MPTLPIPSLEGLSTDRLMFHRPTLEDRGWWMEYMVDPDAIRFMPFRKGSADDVLGFIQRSLERAAHDGSGLHAVRVRATGEPVGMVGLLTQEVDEVAELEVGYHLRPSVWGHGYATEAAIACKRFAFAHRLSGSVISLIDPENHRSQRVAMRNGMHLEKRTIHRGTPALVFRVVNGLG